MADEGLSERDKLLRLVRWIITGALIGGVPVALVMAWFWINGA